MKKFLLPLLVLVSLVCGLLIAEALLRWVRPQPVAKIDPHLYRAESSPAYRLNPGYRGRLSNLVEFDVSVAISGSGLRDEEVGKKTDAEQRLLVLGDSYVFGWGVEASETFVARLAGELSPAMPGIRVINGGVPGYGPVDVADWLERYGTEFDPDLLLVSFFLGNDLIDATIKHRQTDFEITIKNSFSDRLYRRSHLMRLVKRAIPGTVSSRVRGWLGLPEPWSRAYLRDLLESYVIEESSLAREGREATKKALERLAAWAEERNCRVLVSLIPGPLQAIDARWHQGLASLGVDAEAYDPHRPASVFSELAEAQAWPVFDLTPAFRQMVSRGAKLYFRYDPHWTPAGHELAALELRDFVLSETLLQPPSPDQPVPLDENPP